VPLDAATSAFSPGHQWLKQGGEEVGLGGSSRGGGIAAAASTGSNRKEMRLGRRGRQRPEKGEEAGDAA